MAGRSASSRRTSQDSTYLLMRTTEHKRRSLSQGDDTPRSSSVLQGASHATAAVDGSVINPASSQLAGQPAHDTLSPLPPSIFHAGVEPPGHSTNKRLGFLGEKLLSSSNIASSASSIRSTQTAQLLPRSHSRAESANLLRETTASPVPGMTASPSQLAKGHTSPSKLVTREMHRLGTLAHLPVLNPSISTSSTLTLATTTPSSSSTATASADSPWPILHLLILPLFNGEPLRIPIEDLNSLVKRHIQTVISSTPSKALATLEKDATELIANGMVTLNAKLSGIEDEAKLVHRVVEVWGFFWDQVLPYVEGALLPLQTDPMISSLYRTPKVLKPSSPSNDSGGSKNGTSTYSKVQQIDVRTIALQLFRDQIIFPIFHTLHDCLNDMKDQTLGANDLGHLQPRLQQMLLVLVSQRSPPATNSLGSPPPPPPPGEEAIQALLRVIRTPLVHSAPNSRNRRYQFGGTGAPSFLSAGLPRDRRGRIAKKSDLDGHDFYDSLRDDDLEGAETPRLSIDPLREKGWEVLESLRSPDQEGARTSMGGWGLGVGAEEKKSEDDDDEDNLDWVQAQAVVARINSEPAPAAPPEPLTETTPLSRRRLT